MARRGNALPEKIAQDLTRHILAGEYDATHILPSERVLQETYGVSRTVVREALKLLAARGLVLTGNGQGAVVSSNFTAPVIEALMLAFHRAKARTDDLLQTRLLIEPEAAALAAQFANPQQHRRLSDLCDAMEQVSLLDPAIQAQRSFEINAQFHRCIAQASQNPVLEVLIDMLVGIIWHQKHTVDVPSPPERRYEVTAEEHRQITAAIHEGNAEAARAAMAMHLGQTHYHLSQIEGTLDILVQTS
jgi:GntR family transcriptional repressor for pyruvate dehydrogenase complex